MHRRTIRNIDDQAWTRLRLYALEQGRPIGEVLTELILRLRLKR